MILPCSSSIFMPKVIIVIDYSYVSLYLCYCPIIA
ncbi:Uncharacterised protein [Serratia fonticola]|nr:Uncharacterised protein [Serratia fonticola]